ncbi:hypothetical protein HK100_007087 [Physocladia obscura]|uniref:CRAL-TRIO domain-containing protein n=1 Tax=Physocladia obscura TaxID=109957 RepID=A0AAD5TAS1_9FUNG|nr:hypothetical protein HK100_007087 [Physocladia obscura]
MKAILECRAGLAEKEAAAATVLTEVQQKALDEVAAQVPGLISAAAVTAGLDATATVSEDGVLDIALTRWADAAEVHRFLRASKWVPKVAADRLKATLTWRAEYRPDAISPDEVEPEAVTGKQFLSGFDKKGRPLLFLVPRNENTKTYDRQIRYSVFMLEKAVRLMPSGVERTDVIVDYENLDMWNATPLSVSLKFLNVLSSHYPERLGLFVCLSRRLNSKG